MPNKFQDVLEEQYYDKGNILHAIMKSIANTSRCNKFGDRKTYTGEYNKGHEYNKSNNSKFVKYAV